MNIDRDIYDLACLAISKPISAEGMDSILGRMERIVSEMASSLGRGGDTISWDFVAAHLRENAAEVWGKDFETMLPMLKAAVIRRLESSSA